MSSLQSLDLKRRSATTTPPPSARKTTEVAKLIDVSKCIGCKACQVACMRVERPARRGRAQRRHLRQPGRPDRRSPGR